MTSSLGSRRSPLSKPILELRPRLDIGLLKGSLYRYLTAHVDTVLNLYMGLSNNRGPEYSNLNSRILIIRAPKYGTPNFRKLPYPRAPSMQIVPTLGSKVYK